MTVGRRPKRHNPNAEQLTCTCELEYCPHCGERLSAQGCYAHSNKTVQTLDGEYYVVAYSRVCRNPKCEKTGTHYHASGHLQVSPPYSTYGLDVITLVGIKREREHKQFTEIRALLNEQNVAINDSSVGRLYRVFLALVGGTWPRRRQRIAAAAEQHGGLILMADGLSPDGAGPQLYVLWEALSGTPIGGMLIDQADETHLSDWLTGCRESIDDLPVLALVSDKEKALVGAMRAVWPQAPHQLCQMHFMKNLSDPVHRADQSLRQTLREGLGSLPAVPDREAAATQDERLVPEQDVVRKQATLEATTAENQIRESHFDHLLFADSVVTNKHGKEAVLQRYHEYYRQAIQDVLNRSSRKPFQCGGLCGYDQLVGIDRHLQHRHQTHGPDTYLDQLHERVQKALQSAASQASQVRRMHDFLVQVERHLAQAHRSNPNPDAAETNVPAPGSETVRQELDKMVAEFVWQSRSYPIALRLARRWYAMKASWLPHILHCYDIPGLPRSNLDLESAFGTLRRGQRRISGRKETSPLRVFGPEAITLLALDDEDILPLLQSVSPDAYWTQRRRQEEREEPRRWLTRLHHDPEKALSQLDEQFYQVVNAQTEASSDVPDP